MKHITREEIEIAAKKHGCSPDDLQRWVEHQEEQGYPVNALILSICMAISAEENGECILGKS